MGVSRVESYERQSEVKNTGDRSRLLVNFCEPTLLVEFEFGK